MKTKVQTRSASSRLRFHPDAYRFIFEALQYTQQRLRRPPARDPDDEAAHITGSELLEGIRQFALERFGLLARTVFARWGVTGTADFGRIVFELVERGEMRKTERDSIEDFIDVYDFDEVFDRHYRIDTSRAFRG